MISTAIALVWLLAASPAVGAEESPRPGEPSLVGPQWRWNRTLMNDDSVHAPAGGEAARYTVRFAGDGTFSARADCNRVLGSWAAEGRRITLTPGPTTMAQCPEGSLADVFVADLAAAVSYFFSDGELFLDLKFDSGTMSLVALPSELAGTRWRVTGYHDGGDAVVSLLPETEITASFGADGQLAGTAGCNNYRATYEAEGDALAIGPTALTRMHCGEPEGVMEQERLYLAALQRVARRTLDGDRLELRSAEGALLVGLIAADD